MNDKTAVELIKSYDATDNRVVRVLRAQYEIGQGALQNFEFAMIKDPVMAFYWSEGAILGAAQMQLVARMARMIDEGVWGCVDIEHAAGIITHLTETITVAALRVNQQTNNPMGDFVRIADLKVSADLLREIKRLQAE